MGPARVRIWIGALLLSAGCAQSPQPYLDVAYEQRAALKEMTGILETIEDDKTMAAAKASLEERLARFEKIAEKAKALPEPSADVQRRLQEDSFLLNSAAKNLQHEVGRVRRLNLKGGPEFFQHFESKNQALFLAVQP